MSYGLTPHSFSGSRRPWEAAAALLGGAGFTVAAGAAGGESLGMVIGGFFAAALVLPPLLAVEVSLSRRAVTLAAAVGGIGAVWIGLIGRSQASFGQWAGVLGLLAAFCMAFSALVLALSRFKFPPLIAAAAGSGAAIAWLTWPIWLSPAIAGGASTANVNLLVRLNPLLAANGLLTFTSPWTEQSVAYRLTLLGQDMPLRLPTQPAASITAHLVAAGVLLAACRIGVVGNRSLAADAQNHQ
jgi:hypothetical protein